MYARRKGWDVGELEVDVNYEPAQRGSPTRFSMEVRLPKELPEEQQQRLLQIAAKCPVHRTLEGEVMFEERVKPSEARRHRCAPADPAASASRAPLPHLDRPEGAVAQPLVHRAAQLRGLERAHLAAARAAVGESAAHQARHDAPAAAAGGVAATHQMLQSPSWSWLTTDATARPSSTPT